MGKPLYHITIKARGNKQAKRTRVFAVWESRNGQGFNVTPEKAYGDRPGVVALVFRDADGKETTVDLSQCFIDMMPPYDAGRGGGGGGKRSEPDEQPVDDFGGDDIPFG